jgi:hypothetical protein
VFWWNFLEAEGVLVSEGSQVALRVERLNSAFDRALDAWLELESAVSQGEDAYRSALEHFTIRYGKRGAEDWSIPAPLRAS